MAGFAVTAAGLLVTVLVVERVLDLDQERRRRAEEAPLRGSAQRRLRLALSPVSSALAGIYANSGRVTPPAPVNEPQQFLVKVKEDLSAVRIENGTWIGTWLLRDKSPTTKSLSDALEQLNRDLQEILDRAARVLEPKQETAVGAFLLWQTQSAENAPIAIAGQLGQIDISERTDDDFADLWRTSALSWPEAITGFLRILIGACSDGMRRIASRTRCAAGSCWRAWCLR